MAIIIIMGVSGSGKTSIGRKLAAKLGWRFIDADDCHPESNIRKMASGQSLNDEDRLPWLELLNRILIEGPVNQILACSALKLSYRKVIEKDLSDQIQWVYLKGDFETILKRVQKRKTHFMPESLLKSQFDTLEEPLNALNINVSWKKSKIINYLLNTIHMNKEFGIIGLGVMGKSLSLNFAEKGFSLALFNRHVEDKEVNVANTFIASEALLESAAGFDELNSFARSLAMPRKIMLMVDAGAAVDMVIKEILPFLDKGDILIDGGNSHFKDTMRRTRELAERDIHFIGSGVSGGEEGARKGPSIMPGGSSYAYTQVRKYLEAIAAKDNAGGYCCTHIGPDGAGHYVKMIHNGIEYAEMQLIAECYDLMFRAYGFNQDQIAKTFSDWNNSKLSGYLLEISAEIMSKKDGANYWIDQILDRAGNKGTGSWSTISASELGIPATMITAALFARYQSSFWVDRQNYARLFGEMTARVTTPAMESLQKGYSLARIVNHHQGFQLIVAASQKYGWNIELSELARIWTNGCIIRSTLMEQLKDLLKTEKEILQIREIIDLVKSEVIHLKSIATHGIESGIPLPCFQAALDHIHTMSKSRGSAHIIQAQRDYFGAHTFQKLDDPNGPSHHLEWSKL